MIGREYLMRQSHSAKLRKSETLPQMLDRRLLLYALAAGATLASSTPSQAEVVFTPSNAVLSRLGKFDIDLDNDGSADFTILRALGRYSTYESLPDLFAYGKRPSHQIVTKSFSALALAKNTQIGPGQDFRAFTLMETPFYEGYWRGAKSRCLGVRFLSHGEVHYGWIGFREVRGFAAASFYGWAYETVPDKPILAGDTGTGAPLDSSISPTSLEVLATGHTAIREHRKRTALVEPGM
jgi:hypothetical protein